MFNLKQVGNCPGCDHVDIKHAGGFCYNCHTFCGWRILGKGNVWGVPAGWWSYLDLPQGKSFSMVPMELEEE